VKRSIDPIDAFAGGSFDGARLWWNLSAAELYEAALLRREGRLTRDGALSCTTGTHTGRSPKDKFIVQDATTDPHVHWGEVNRPMTPSAFEALDEDIAEYLRNRDVYIQDLAGGADPDFQLPVRVITEQAWHSLFAMNLLRRGGFDAATGFLIVSAPGFRAVPSRHGTNSETVIAVNMTARRVLIGGTAYAGEIKKSVFTILNYLLPFRNVLPMHCSANVGADGAVALFFGLSGTGKTTLSSDPTRQLIGDDEHGWSDRGVFNFEGGCYAKTIRLSPALEPQIASAATRFGTVLENVAIDGSTRVPDFDAATTTENTRAAYPLRFVEGHVPSGMAGHPRDIVMLTADAFGVMPPIARLSPEAAMYHFLSGYTARVAGTERGVTTPSATFSAGFGAPFLPLRPGVYANFLGRRIGRHRARVWLVNTGWTGGPHGEGSRMPLDLTRAMVSAALDGTLDAAPMRVDSVFGIEVPCAVSGVPDRLLDPRSTWRDPSAYDAQARTVAAMFRDNFARFVPDVAPEVAAAGPRA
jgi:phosphoenolpyruvate carboxykinase (ATP)